MRQVSVCRVLLLAVLAGAAMAQQTTTQQPYRGEQKQPLIYRGDGRSDPDPVEIGSVNIGFFGPEGLGTSRPELMWQGASLAFEQANQAGGYHGVPFRLTSVWAQSPWAGGAAKLVRAIYEDSLWAIIGGIDGSSTHLAEQVVTKSQVVLLNPAATDRTIHGANVPWTFSCVPGDDKIAKLISDSLARRKLPFALLSSTEHDARVFTTELRHAFDADRISPAAHIQFDPVSFSATSVAADALQSNTGAIAIMANADESKALILELRKKGFEGLIVAGPWLSSLAPSTQLSGVLTPRLGDVPASFQRKFAKRYNHSPDYAAAHAYDAANILIAAIRDAGLNRVRILDSVRANSPFKGVTGTIEWDALGQNRRAPNLDTVAPEH